MQYVGARYVPKFMGTYNPTQDYENMVVVDNGMGTSYISKVPVPANTPLTDTDYWAIYGASNGAIINLQNQIGDLSSLNTSDQSSLVNAINEIISDTQKSFVTPEMFGAVGDGVTDDTAAMTACFNADANIILGKDKIYLISSELQLNRGNKVIIGNNSKILATGEIGILNFTYQCEKLVLSGIDFEAVIPTDNPSALVTFQNKDNNSYINDSAKNIIVENCTFTGGTIQLQLMSSTNVKVLNCTFNDCGPATGLINGGYCILIGSSYNVDISNCIFTNQEHVRHKIYSAVVAANAHLENINVSIRNNIFDDTDQLYAATNTSAIAVRINYRIVIENNTFIHCVGLTVGTENGDAYVDILHNTFIDTVFRSSGDAPSETRSAISIQENTYTSHVNIRNNNEIGTPQGTIFIQVGGGNDGVVVDNHTVASKYLVLYGDIYADNNTNYDGVLYRFIFDDTPFTGSFGDNLKFTNTNNAIYVGTTNTKLSLKQMPQKFLNFHWDSDLVTWDKIIAAYSSTKNSANDFTLTLPWCSDNDCYVIPKAVDGNYFVKVVSVTQNNGLQIRIKCVAFDGTDYTSAAKFGFKLVPAY